MSRGLSTVRASVSRLRQLALIERSGDERTVLDLSAVARQVGFVPGLSSGSEAPVCAEREVRIAPASSGERQLSGGHDRQNLGGSASTRIDNNIINNLDSITAPASQLETRQIVDLVRLYQKRGRGAARAARNEIRELLRLVAGIIGDRDWSEEACRRLQRRPSLLCSRRARPERASALPPPGQQRKPSARPFSSTPCMRSPRLRP